MTHPWVGVEEGQVPLKQLSEPVVPEPRRHGEGDRARCGGSTVICGTTAGRTCTCGSSRVRGYLDLRGSFLVNGEETLPRATEAQVLAAAADLRSRLQG